MILISLLEEAYWICLVQLMDRSRVLLNTVANIWAVQYLGGFLVGLGTISSSRLTLLHIVS